MTGPQTRTPAGLRKNGYASVPSFLAPEKLLDIGADLRHLVDAVGARIGVSSAEVPAAEIDRTYVEMRNAVPNVIADKTYE